MSEQGTASGGQGSQKLPDQATDGVLKTEAVRVERKTIVLTLKENHNGRFLRISERAGSHENTIIIPATGLPGLRKALDGMVDRMVDG